LGVKASQKANKFPGKKLVALTEETPPEKNLKFLTTLVRHGGEGEDRGERGTSLGLKKTKTNKGKTCRLEKETHKVIRSGPLGVLEKTKSRVKIR